MNLEIDNHHLVVGAKLPSLEFSSIGILSQNQCCMNRCCERERERERERESYCTSYHSKFSLSHIVFMGYLEIFVTNNLSLGTQKFLVLKFMDFC